MNDIEKMMRILEFADCGFPREKSNTGGRTILIASAAAAALALILSVIRPAEKEPVDTFKTPELAYAKAEEAFSRINRSIDKCLDRTERTYNKIIVNNE